MVQMLFVVLIPLTCVILIHLVERCYRQIRMWWIVNKIPGPLALPIVGTGYKFLWTKRKDLFQLVINDVRENKGSAGIFRTWIGLCPEVILTKPHQVEMLLSSKKYIRKGEVYEYLTPWLGTGLITSNGALWQERRKLLTSAFHFSILKQSADVMLEKFSILLQIIEEKHKQNPNKPIDIYTLASSCALDVICETAMGTSIDAQRSPQQEYPQAVKKVEGSIYSRMLHRWFLRDWLYYMLPSGRSFNKDIKVLKSFTEKVIEERKIRRAEERSSRKMHNGVDDTIGKKRPMAFLDILLSARDNNESPLTDEGIRNEVDTFMWAGHETTSVAISMCLFCLGNEPEVQEKVHEELNNVFGNSTEPATHEQLSALKYLQLVIKESLRYYPVIPFTSRQLDEDLIIDGYTVPKGCQVILNIFHLHRDPDLWVNPDTFDPDRFLPANSRGRHSYSYVPFSAGPRNCIGQKYAQQELMFGLTAILRKWQVRSAMKHSEITFYAEITLHPTEPLNLFFIPKKLS